MAPLHNKSFVFPERFQQDSAIKGTAQDYDMPYTTTLGAALASVVWGPIP